MKNKESGALFFKIFKEIETGIYYSHIPGEEPFCPSEYRDLATISLDIPVSKAADLTTQELRHEIDILYGQDAFMYTITSIVMFGFMESDILSTMGANKTTLITAWWGYIQEMKELSDNQDNEYEETPYMDIVEHIIERHNLESYIAALILLGKATGENHKQEEEYRIMRSN